MQAKCGIQDLDLKIDYSASCLAPLDAACAANLRPMSADNPMLRPSSQYLDPVPVTLHAFLLHPEIWC